MHDLVLARQELAESLDAKTLVAEANRAPLAWVQRLGYLLSLVEASELAAAASSRTRGTGGGSEPTAQDLRLERLERLLKLRADGILDDDEFRAEKSRILIGEQAIPPVPH